MTKKLYDFGKIAIVGLGYVGLPLALEFGKKINTVGYDINIKRIEDLKKLHDATNEVAAEEITASQNLSLTSNLSDIQDCNIYIITVPTPIDEYLKPDFKPLISASENVGNILKAGDCVIYESTVYPGATEEVCVPILEEKSGLRYNIDFTCGYSPERINPGDKECRLSNIVKITSGSSDEAAEFIDELYKVIIEVGTHKVSSMKVAEAAKVIENTQRDLNIALINELAIIFDKLEIDTEEVLEASGTKWNFMPFRPGLVGGHCIGVDPYYLMHKSQSVGYIPDVIIAGRRINNGMGEYVAEKLVRKMLIEKIHVNQSRILIMGLTFKEDCPDLRNSKVVDVVKVLKSYGALVDLSDPHADPDEVENIFKISKTDTLAANTYDAILIAVGHKKYRQTDSKEIRKLGKESHVLFDLKYIFEKSESDIRL